MVVIEEEYRMAVLEYKGSTGCYFEVVAWPRTP
jgi:hypothetical protein